MPHVTTIYLASDRPERFRFLEDRFPKEVTLTRDYTKADLLIIDLSYPGEKWPWLGASANWRVEEAPCSTPFLLVAWDGPEDPDLFNTITRMKEIGPDVHRVYRSQEELGKALLWIRSMFPPFRNASMEHEMWKGRTEMVLQALRQGEAARG